MVLVGFIPVLSCLPFVIFLFRFGFTVLVGFITENSFQSLLKVACWNAILKYFLQKQDVLRIQTVLGYEL